MFGPYSLQIIIKYDDNVAIAACIYIYNVWAVGNND